MKFLQKGKEKGNDMSNDNHNAPETVELTAEEDLTNINRILDLLDEDDDVQEVYHNWDE